MRVALGFTSLLLIFLISCVPAPSPPSQQSTSMEDSPSVIPDDLTYEIIGSDTVPGMKRSLDVRLSREVSEETLRALAHRLKDLDSSSYERTFIVYYLPDMTVDAGGWATSHFNPELEIKILGDLHR